MDRPSDEFLSCARLTFDEDREWRVGHLADLLDNLLHLRAGADQPRYRRLDDPVRLPQLTRAFLHDDLELVDMPLESELLLLAPAAQLARLDGSAQNRDEVIPVDRLLDEVVGPAAERVHHEIVLSMAGDHERGRIGPARPNLCQELETIDSGHLDVRDDGVVVLKGDLVERSRP